MAVAEPTIDQFSNPVAKYLVATRPGFLLASFVPCFIGLATAAYSGIAINWIHALITVLGAVAVQAGVNVLNDYYDALNGTDEHNRERLFPFTGGSRFIQNGVLTVAETGRYGAALLIAGGILGALLLPVAGKALIAVGAVGLLLGWAYSAPPLALNGHGLGEISVALGFGTLIPLGADLVQRGELSLLPVAAGAGYALLVACLLYINQFPDRAADELAGKWHWVVRLGARRARWGYIGAAVSAYVLIAVFVARGTLPLGALLGLLSLPLSLQAGLRLMTEAENIQALEPGIRATIGAMVLHGFLLSAGLVISA